uniref:CCHC-type domain-containing protein n=1 Tax=Panagrolaimus sp. PS1159 TaxID=55785 RepID=A0AC35GPK9_9BILA
MECGYQVKLMKMKECLKEEIMKLDLENDFQEAMRKMKILEAVKAKIVQESVADEDMVEKVEPELENESFGDSGKTYVVSGRFSMKTTVIGASQKAQVYPEFAAKSKNAENKAEFNKEFGEGEQTVEKEEFAHQNGKIIGTFLDFRERKLFSYVLGRVLIKEMMDVRERKLFALLEKTIAEKDFHTLNPEFKYSSESLKCSNGQENDEVGTPNALCYILNQLQQCQKETAKNPNSKTPTIEIFTGEFLLKNFTGSPHMAFAKWVTQFEYSLAFVQIPPSPQQKLARLLAHLEGAAKLAYEEYDADIQQNYDQLVNALKNTFTNAAAKRNASSSLTYCSQKENESVHDFSTRLTELVRTAMDGETTASVKAVLLFMLKERLRNDIKGKINLHECTTYEEVLKKAIDRENYVSQKAQITGLSTQSDANFVEKKRIQCYVCHKEGHFARDCYFYHRQRAPEFDRRNFHDNSYQPEPNSEIELYNLESDGTENLFTVSPSEDDNDSSHEQCEPAPKTKNFNEDANIINKICEVNAIKAECHHFEPAIAQINEVFLEQISKELYKYLQNYRNSNPHFQHVFRKPPYLLADTRIKTYIHGRVRDQLAIILIDKFCPESFVTTTFLHKIDAMDEHDSSQQLGDSHILLETTSWFSLKLLDESKEVELINIDTTTMDTSFEILLGRDSMKLFQNKLEISKNMFNWDKPLVKQKLATVEMKSSDNEMVDPIATQSGGNQRNTVKELELVQLHRHNYQQSTTSNPNDQNSTAETFIKAIKLAHEEYQLEDSNKSISTKDALEKFDKDEPENNTVSSYKQQSDAINYDANYPDKVIPAPAQFVTSLCSSKESLQSDVNYCNSQHFRPKVYIPGYVNCFKIKILLNTAADVSLISSQIVKKLKLKIIYQSNSDASDIGETNSSGHVKVNLKLAEVESKVKIPVLELTDDQHYDVLLGWDLFEYYPPFEIDAKNQCIKIGNFRYRINILNESELKSESGSDENDINETFFYIDSYINSEYAKLHVTTESTPTLISKNFIDKIIPQNQHKVNEIIHLKLTIASFDRELPMKIMDNKGIDAIIGREGFKLFPSTTINFDYEFVHIGDNAILQLKEASIFEEFQRPVRTGETQDDDPNSNTNANVQQHSNTSNDPGTK